MENKLFDYFKDSGKLYGLSGDQLVKFQQACNKAVCDNPTLDFNDLLSSLPKHYKRFSRYGYLNDMLFAIFSIAIRILCSIISAVSSLCVLITMRFPINKEMLTKTVLSFPF